MSDQQFLPQRHHGRLVLPPRSRVILEAVVRLTFQVVMDYYSGALYTSDAFEDESGHEDIDIDEGKFHTNHSHMPCKLHTQQHAPWQNASSCHHQSLSRMPKGLDARTRAD